jgi:hypothetical protein
MARDTGGLRRAPHLSERRADAAEVHQPGSLEGTAIRDRSAARICSPRYSFANWTVWLLIGVDATYMMSSGGRDPDELTPPDPAVIHAVRGRRRHDRCIAVQTPGQPLPHSETALPTDAETGLT